MEKFKNIISMYPGSLLDLISKKKENYKIRLKGQNEHLSQQFNGELDGILRLNELLKLDEILKDIIVQMQNNIDGELTDTEGIIYRSVMDEYSSIYSIIENFNEGSPDVNQIFISREWTQLGETIRNSFQFDQKTGLSIKLKSLQDSVISLYSIIKAIIGITQANSNKNITQLEGYSTAIKAIDNINQNTELISSAIESAKSIKTFNVNNIDEALRSVGEMFYNKDAYLVFQNTKWTLSILWKKAKENILEKLFFLLNDFFESPKWWLLIGIIPLITLFIILGSEYSVLFQLKGEDLQKYKEFWQIILSIHLIGASFLGYTIVFCFSNYKKLEHRHEAYRFRGVLTRSFGYLLKSADEEQKKILYPKALDAIFRDLPDSGSPQQDVNISLPITEIMKGFTGK